MRLHKSGAVCTLNLTQKGIPTTAAVCKVGAALRWFILFIKRKHTLVEVIEWAVAVYECTGVDTVYTGTTLRIKSEADHG